MDIIFKSLISSVFTAIILVVVKFFGPKLAGAIGSIPLIFAISYVLLTMQDKKVAQNLLWGDLWRDRSNIF